MSSYPNRCQHIKVNGTQCGSPALRRNRFCYFHKRHHEERVAIHLDQLKNDRVKGERRRRQIIIDLPVLEDANSIQVSLMQIMRLVVAGQIDSRSAGLLLYALQTASNNLQRTKFEPLIHDVILDPRAVSETLLNESVWQDDDFEEECEYEDEEEDEEEQEEDEQKEEAKPRLFGHPRARLGKNCVITVEGKEIYHNLPLEILKRTVKELNFYGGGCKAEDLPD